MTTYTCNSCVCICMYILYVIYHISSLAVTFVSRCRHVVVTLSRYCHVVVTLLSRCCHVVVTLLSRCCRVVVTLLSRCRLVGHRVVVALLSRCCHVAVTLLSRCFHVGVGFSLVVHYVFNISKHNVMDRYEKMCKDTVSTLGGGGVYS